MIRIVIIGTTGAGKTTLAQRAAAVLSVPMIDLDDLYWLPAWTPRDPADFTAKVEAAAGGPAWVIAGNYSAVRDRFWPRATHIVWVDYCFFRVFGQLLRRCYSRAWRGSLICNGNRETWRRMFFRDSILLWFFKTYAKNRRRYAEIFAAPGLYPHLAYSRLTSPAEAEAWLSGLEKNLENLK